MTSTKCRGSAPTRLPTARSIAERGAGSYASGYVLGALVTLEAYEQALAFTEELERAARAQGSVANVITSGTYRGWIALLRGDLAGAEEILRPLVDISAQSGMVLVLVTLLWGLPDVIAERPSQDAARGTDRILGAATCVRGCRWGRLGLLGVWAGARSSRCPRRCRSRPAAGRQHLRPARFRSGP